MDSRYVSFVALGLGGVGLVLSFVFFNMPLVPLVFGVAGIVLGNIANKIEKNVIATAGFVLSVIAVALSAFFLAAGFMLLACTDQDIAMSALSRYDSIPGFFSEFKALL